MKFRVVIGKNFGDEGKGLATDYFAMLAQREGSSCLVIRHNGGAQAGHTVDFPDKRFVFHQLSSGSFRGADTYWAEPFLPDLYKLRGEINDFRKLSDFVPKIYGNENCRCGYIDDVLINMALERSRGDSRHGSCGMGINEAVKRSEYPQFRLTLGEVCRMSAQSLYKRLQEIRGEYLNLRLEKLGLSLNNCGEYGELLQNPNVLYNVSEEMCRASEGIKVCRDDIAKSYEQVIFEGAQGLLLDQNYRAFAPHLTTSDTGIKNPMEFMCRNFPKEVPEIVYISRTYVTRHGAGPLPREGEFDHAQLGIDDKTNIFNEWQGQLRYAPHGDFQEFIAPIKADLSKNGVQSSVSLMFTHLNETQGRIFTVQGNPDLKSWYAENRAWEIFNRVYLSDSEFSEDITCEDLNVPN